MYSIAGYACMLNMSRDCVDTRDFDEQTYLILRYHEQGKELVSSHEYFAAQACLRKVIDTIEEHKVQSDVELDVLVDFVAALEALVEEYASFTTIIDINLNETFGYNIISDHVLLQDIASAYGRISEIKSQFATIAKEDVADAFLDYAFAAKRAGNVKQCTMAHLKRMELCPRYKVTDAVRLLGLSVDCFDNVREESIPSGELIEEISQRGLFEADVDECQHYQPSKYARQLGNRARDVLKRHDYTLQRCTSYLIPHICNPFGQSISMERIFSANSFFNHRHEVWEQIDDENTDEVDGPQMLALLFLFGLAVDREEAECALETVDLDALITAGLLRSSLARASDIISEVQIYPLSPRDLCGNEGAQIEGNCFFVTDFPMQSMRLPRNAIMPVGYDTLELLALSASAKRCSDRRTLDMCCGSGIQGIFSLYCNLFKGDYAQTNELVMTDINERAMHFATANLALNGIHQDASAVCGDLFEPLSTSGDSKFDRILSNPPFVAVPSYVSRQLQPALYAVGGGTDGMDVLRRMMKNCLDFLDDNENSIIILVSEVPNVEESCNMLRLMLPEEKRSQARIRVAYVEDDVETTGNYSLEREYEAGIECTTRDWSDVISSGGVYNRALVLISIAHDRGDDKEGIYIYKGNNDFSWSDATEVTDTIVEDADEEDAFLQADGIAFARTALL